MLELLGERWERQVPVGGTLSFGRGGDDVDLVLAEDSRLHRRCGVIAVDDSGWELHNTGRWLRIRVISLDRFGVDSVLPGQRVRIPWNDVRVQVHVGDRSHDFRALHRSDHQGSSVRATDSVAADPTGEATSVPVRVDRSSGYFRALVALCEPQLRDPSSGEVATDLQIARRLNGTGLEARRLTGKTVERRLDNCRSRFGLKVVDEFGMSSGLERRDSRRLLVEVALLTATVTEGDLQLLGHDDRPDARR